MKRVLLAIACALAFPLFSVAEVYTCTNGTQVTIADPQPANVLTRLPGPHWGWGHCLCRMCLANSLIAEHGIDGGGYRVGYNLRAGGYLGEIGYTQFEVLHDNLHNSPSFAGHIKNGRPSTESLFAPTPLDVVDAGLRLAKVNADDVVYDLGCGDGRVCVMASKAYGARSVGVDIDSVCVQQTQQNMQANGVQGLGRAYNVDMLGQVDSDKYATVVFVYLTPETSGKMAERLKKMPAGTRVVANDMPVPGLKVSKTKTVTSKSDGRRYTLYLTVVGGQRLKFI